MFDLVGTVGAILPKDGPPPSQDGIFKGRQLGAPERVEPQPGYHLFLGRDKRTSYIFFLNSL